MAGYWLSAGQVSLIMGILFFMVAILIAIQTRNLIKNSIKTNAIVVKSVAQDISKTVRTRVSHQHKITYHPILRYTSFGQEYEIKSSLGHMYKPKYKDGESVKIIVSSKDPKQIIMAKGADLIIGPIIFGGLGLLFIVIGLVALL